MKLTTFIVIALLLLPISYAVSGPTVAWEMEDASTKITDLYNAYNATPATGAYQYEIGTFGRLGKGINQTTAATTATTTYAGIKTGDFTLEYWFRNENTNDQTPTTGDASYWGGLRFNAGGVAGKVELYVDGASCGAGCILACGTNTSWTNVSTIHQYMITRSGNLYAVAIDGNFKCSGTIAADFDRGNFKFGHASIGGVGTFYAARIYDGVVFNNTEASDLYNGGQGRSIDDITGVALVNANTNFSSGYNYADQITWRTNKAYVAMTTDTTPTLMITTTLQTNCSIGNCDYNYTSMSGCANTAVCSEQNSTTHTCTIPTAFTTQNNSIAVSCSGMAVGQTTSLSGLLNITIWGIGTGVATLPACMAIQDGCTVNINSTCTYIQHS